MLGRRKQLTGALAQVEFIRGSDWENARRLAEAAEEAAGKGARLIVLPSLCLCGHSQPSSIEVPEAWHGLFKTLLGLSTKAVLVLPLPHPVCAGFKGRFLVFAGGKLVEVDSGEFLIDAADVRVAVLSLPHSEEALQRVAEAGAQVVCLTGQRRYLGEDLSLYDEALGAEAKALGLPVFYVNPVGVLEGYVLGGGSLIAGPEGDIVGRAPSFQQSLLVAKVAIGRKSPLVASPLPRLELPFKLCEATRPAEKGLAFGALAEEEALFQALATGIRAELGAAGASRALVIVNEEPRSLLALTLTVGALGPERTVALTCPLEGKEQACLLAASKTGAKELLLPFRELSNRLGTGRQAVRLAQGLVEEAALMLARAHGWLLVDWRSPDEAPANTSTPQVFPFEEARPELFEKLARYVNLRFGELLPAPLVHNLWATRLHDTLAGPALPRQALRRQASELLARHLDSAHLLALGFVEGGFQRHPVAVSRQITETRVILRLRKIAVTRTPD